MPDRYDDYGYSGGDLDRPAYQRLIAECEQGKIDKIIVFRIDRMTRSTKDFCEFDEKMKKLGVGFTSVSEPFVDTSSPMGELENKSRSAQKLSNLQTALLSLLSNCVS